MNLTRSIDQAMPWLNAFDGPYVTDPDLIAQLREINNTQIFGQPLEDLVQKTIQTGQALGDERLHRELGVQLAAAYFKKDLLEPSRTCFEDAIDQFRKAHDAHREAVATWMLGSCLWLASGCRQAAFEHWASSRDLFKMQAYHALRIRPDPARLKWYQSRIGEMSIWMARTLEEAYTWLNIFDTPSLEPPTIVLRDQMMAEVILHRYSQARRYMSEMMILARDTGDYQQLPEVFVESGRAEYQMDNLEEAERRLEEADLRYAPGSHRQAVARWMLGCARWQIRGKEHLAIRGWQQAIVLFEALAAGADRRANPTRSEWYRERLREMQGALEAEIKDM